MRLGYGIAVAIRVAMQRVLPILFVMGCAIQPTSTSGQTTTPQGTTFATDTFYTGIVPPYATPEACEASNPMPIECHLELGFCAGGKAGFSNYDLPQQGDYHLEGSLIVANIGGNMIQLDTGTGAATNAFVDTYILDTAERWQTLQFDVITCPDAR